MNDKELNTAVNPTSNTAITTLIMAYVSSAGLRVLLMMYKSLEDKDRFELIPWNNRHYGPEKSCNVKGV